MTSETEKLFEELDNYDWDNDKEFQAGLAAILGPDPNPSQLRDLTIRARCFYYARKKNIKIDYDAYKTHVHSKNSDSVLTASPPPPPPPPQPTSTAESADPNPAYPTSFADIVAMIQEGKPIPGIKDIPSTVLSDKATKPTASRRRKPWEKDDEPVVGENEGTFGNDRDRIIQQDVKEDGALIAGDEATI